MTTQNIKKKQHYVPQFYLNGFTNNERKLYCFKKENGQSFYAHPADICRDLFHYEVPWGQSNNLIGQNYVLQGTIEDAFGEREKVFAPTLKRIISICSSNVNKNALICSKEEHETLCEMIADFIVRNPNSINKKHFSEEKERILHTDDFKVFSNDAKSLGFNDITPIIEYVQQSELYGMGDFDKTFMRIKENLLELTYAFHLSQNSFITSDSPVIYKIEDEKIAMAYLPLCSHLAVTFSNKCKNRNCRNRCSSLSDDLIKKCNGQYIDYDLAHLLISNKCFSINDFERVNRKDISK